MTALVAGGLGVVSPADAARKPTASEAKAIKKGFFKGRSKVATKIRSIRVSTVSRRYSAVSYSTDVKISKFTKAPTPVVLKKGKSWKPVPPKKVPSKVKKDLKKKAAKSNRNKGTELAYESGQPSDAFSPSGFLHMDAGGWGIIDADLAKPPTAEITPLAVFVKGYWDCR